MRNQTSDAKPYTYQAPMIYLGIFYGALVAWTVICIVLIGFKLTQSQWGNLLQLFMIAFIIGMTWYFSMGISYRVRMEGDGTLWLVSFRRNLKVDPKKMELIEGPHLPIGFIRFRLEREKAYLFCVVKDETLQQVLSRIREINPDIKFKSLPHNP